MGTVFVSFQTVCLLSLPLKRGQLFVFRTKVEISQKGGKKKVQETITIRLTVNVVKLHAG